MGTFGVGVVGIGDISDVYIANLKRYPDVVEVVGCGARDLKKARAKSEQHGLRRAYASPDELFADPDVDIVLNLTVPSAHAELNLAALRAGRHVYSEKPLAATFSDSHEIMALAKTSGLRVGCAPDTFLGGRLQACRALIDEGRLGDVVAASAFVVTHGHEWHHPNPAFFYQQGGGPLLDLGPYYVTALLALLGPVDVVAAMAGRGFPERTVQTEPRRGSTIAVEVDTHVTGSLRFASGALATIVASFDVWDSDLPRLELYGTLGTISISDPDPLDGPNLFGGSVALRDASHARWLGMPRPRPLADPIEVEIALPFTSTSHADNSRGIGLVDMAYAIRDGRPARASGEMALHAIEVMEAMLRSAHEDRFVKMSTTFERPAPLPPDWPAVEGWSARATGR
jgi:predicted dehydrogenase